MRVSGAATVVGFGLVAGFACSPPNIAGDPLKGTTTEEAFEGATCSAVRPQTEPDLMAWDPGSRSNLNRLRRQGVVAVRYEAKGCNVELELLSNCIGKTGKYEYSPYSANEHKVAHNANELFAQLPVGAARLTGSVKGTRALRTDYMMAGQYALPAGTEFKMTDLRGPDCGRATHVVSAVYVGAFAMGAGESRAIASSATLFGAGAGATTAADVEVIGDEGDADACKVSQRESKENERCAVPLRIGLVALQSGSPELQANRPQAQPTAAVAPVVHGSVPASPHDGMVLVPAGTFSMGTNDEAFSDADSGLKQPVRRMTVGSFWMDVTEVTVGAYETCWRAGTCTTDHLVGSDRYCNWGKTERRANPINCVDANQAAAFCHWAGKRLPSEEEWEYAARGKDGRTFPWGNEPPRGQLCWSPPESGLRNGTCDVGAFDPGKSPFGVLDMAGNVWEWTSTSMANSTQIQRGGGWGFGYPYIVRSANRRAMPRTVHNDGIGFRCVRSN